MATQADQTASDHPPPPRPSWEIHRFGLDLRVATRSVVVCGVLIAGAVLAAMLALRIGDYPLTLAQVARSLVGQEDGFAATVVVEWRLPRAFGALIFGAALGVSGAMFQSLTRTPLGSPDIIGFTTGSYTGALIVIIFAGGGFAAIATGSLVGGLVTAVAVYAFAYRRGVTSFRLIIVGIGMTAMLNAVNTYLLMRADREVALAGATWGAGSVSGLAWSQVAPVSVLLIIVFVLAGLVSRPMRASARGPALSRQRAVQRRPRPRHARTRERGADGSRLRRADRRFAGRRVDRSR